MNNVTFNIDVSDQPHERVFIAGDFSDWSYIEILDSNESIYSYTIELESNKVYEYKFLLARPGRPLPEWEYKHESNPPFFNRILEVFEDDINLPPSKFNIFN